MDKKENKNNLKTISGHVDRVVFQDSKSGKVILSVAQEDGKTCRMIGYIKDVATGDYITATGKWNKDEKFGWQFMAESVQTGFTTDNEDVVEDGMMHAFDFSNVLSNSLKAFRNVGAIIDYDDTRKNDSAFIFLDGAIYNREMTTLILAPRRSTSFNIPDTVTLIAAQAFMDCKFESVVIPESVTTIGRNAFNGCSSLKSITISNSLKKICLNAFKGCNNLTCVKISDITSWCDIDFQSTWDDCYANPLYLAHNLELNGNPVTEIVIPDGITEIKASSFINCKCLEKVTLPSSVTKISSRAFYGCSNLVIDVPDTVTKIGNDAFAHCKSFIMDCNIDVEWEQVVFGPGCISFPGPFGYWYEIKDNHINTTVGTLRKSLKKLIPCLTVHYGINGEATIVNAKQLHDIFMTLQIKNDLANLIREGLSTTEILQKIDELSETNHCLFIPRDKTPYISFLLEHHASDRYPIVPIEEYIGGVREGGALYTVMIDGMPNIVWENNTDARASYVFRCTEDDYIETRQLVFDFIMAEVPQKRKYINTDECLTIFKEKPRMVVHNNVTSWAQRLMCDPNIEVPSS